MRALLGTAAHFCQVIVLKSRTLRLSDQVHNARTNCTILQLTGHLTIPVYNSKYDSTSSFTSVQRALQPLQFAICSLLQGLVSCCLSLALSLFLCPTHATIAAVEGLVAYCLSLALSVSLSPPPPAQSTRFQTCAFCVSVADPDRTRVLSRRVGASVQRTLRPRQFAIPIGILGAGFEEWVSENYQVNPKPKTQNPKPKTLNPKP